LTLRDNQTKNTLARDKPIGKYHAVAAKDYHPDCRADLIQIVALQMSPSCSMITAKKHKCGSSLHGLSAEPA